MTTKELEKLSDEELRDISLQKDKKGRYTADADKAQRIRQDRSLHWGGVARKTSVEATYIREYGRIPE